MSERQNGDGPQESCAVMAVSGTEHASRHIYFGLRALQHRGQESAGIATFSRQLHDHKGMGLVHEVFGEMEIASLAGKIGIGHVRYSTTGSSKIKNAQPIVVPFTTSDDSIALAHNGDIVNSESTRRKMMKDGFHFDTTTDSELLAKHVAFQLEQHGDPVKAFRSMDKVFRGAYCVVVLWNKTVMAYRDRLGIRPLAIGEFPDGGAHAVGSESVALDMLGCKNVRDVEPGELLIFHDGKMESRRIAKESHYGHCMFEWVYFARPDSTIQNALVYQVRFDIGKALARLHPVEADVVVPVPDSGRPQAYGFSDESGIPAAEGLIKNRYVGRTFIMPGKDDRGMNVRVKLNAVRPLIKDKRVVLVDDSIVRGTTMRRIVHHLKEAGAKEVHVRVGCPPIIAPCYLGIDMKTRDQFIANGKDVSQISKELGADTVRYLTIDEMVKAIGQKREDLCVGCLTGYYPLKIPGERERFQRTLFDTKCG